MEVAGSSETAHTLAVCNHLDSIRTTIPRLLAYCCLNAIREQCQGFTQTTTKGDDYNYYKAKLQLSPSAAAAAAAACDSFMMVYAQHSSIFHWAVHQPITFFPCLKSQRWFKPLTEELWLPLRRHFFFMCTHVHKLWNVIVNQDCWIRIQKVCRESLKRARSSHWFFNQYYIHLLRKPVRRDLLLCDRWQTSAQVCICC